MEITINGKVIKHISALNLVRTNGQFSSYVVYDDITDNGNKENQVLFFKEDELEDIKVK